MENLWSILTTILLAGLTALATTALRLGKYQQKVDSLESDVEKLENDVKSLTKSVTACETRLEERGKYSPQHLLKKGSPISLSKEGEELLKAGRGDKFVEMNLEDLTNRIKEKSPKTAYDVQVLSQDILRSIQNEDRFNEIKNFAFKEAVELDSMFIVMGVYLRDLALARLGFSLEDIDRSDPHLVKPAS